MFLRHPIEKRCFLENNGFFFPSQMKTSVARDRINVLVAVNVLITKVATLVSVRQDLSGTPTS